jgi:hypothetical protein
VKSAGEIKIERVLCRKEKLKLAQPVQLCRCYDLLDGGKYKRKKYGKGRAPFVPAFASLIAEHSVRKVTVTKKIASFNIDGRERSFANGDTHRRFPLLIIIRRDPPRIRMSVFTSYRFAAPSGH